MTKIIRNCTVLEAARERLEFLFANYDRVICNSSGGKDSTVLVELALEVATKLGKLPLDVAFLDQEAEWTSTVEYMRHLQARPGIKLHWFQVPFRINNSSSGDPSKEWLYSWRAGDKWLRPKEPNAITEPFENNPDMEFYDCLDRMPDRIARAGERVVVANGQRAEENLTRHAGLTTRKGPHGMTWIAKGKRYNRAAPLYDWRVRDVWTAIANHGWRYSTLYDAQFRLGINIRDMRLSSLTHEQAIENLQYVQEIDPDLWDALTERLSGVHGCGNFGREWLPTELPENFKTWQEFRNHLLNSYVHPDRRHYFAKHFEFSDRKFQANGFVGYDTKFCRPHCMWIATNDWLLVKSIGHRKHRHIVGFEKWLKGDRTHKWVVGNPCIPRT